VPNDSGAAELQAHMARTYFSLRVGMGAIGAALPWLLWLGGRLVDHAGLRCSMSAYYYSPAMRDTFVGALVTIGAFLYLYKGFSPQENRALNLGGAFAVGVAMIPTRPGCMAGVSLHGTLAALFFLCVAYVCIFRAADTLSLVRDARRAARFRTIYRLLGVAMIVLPAAAAALTVLVEPRTPERPLVFFVEAAAVSTFAAYWLVKSREMAITNAEQLAVERKLKVSPKSPAVRRPSPGRVVHVEPDDAARAAPR
jgi:hypothetical protein